MTLDLGDGRRLVLAVGEEGWIWLAAGAVAIALLFALSRSERRLVPRRVGWLLLGLRCLAALALAFALLEPIAERSWTERVEGRLIVGVDRSASMETIDARRPVDEQDRLRLAPGLAPPSEPEGGPPPTRLATASRILKGPALAELDRSFAIEAYRFARSTTPADLGSLADSLDRGEALTDEDDPLDRLATDWGAVLDRALTDDPAAPVLGVVLLTDGLRNMPPEGSRGPAGDPIDRLAEAGVPVFPVLIGSTIPPRDAAVTSLQAPESVFSGDSVAIAVEVKADGFDPGAEIPVRLEVPGVGTFHERVAAGPDGSRAVASFRVTIEQAGPLELDAAVEPPGGPDDWPENDHQAIPLRVTDDPARVLLVDSEARWEFRYLRAALDRDRRVEVSTVLLAPPPPSGASEPTFSSEFPPAPPDGSGGPDPITNFDVIILGDVPPELAPEGLWDRLHTYVSDQGGSLVISAGPRAWPAPWRENDLARALLPVLDPAPLAVDRAAIDPDRPTLPSGALLLPDAEAASSPTDWPMLQFAADPAESLAIWEGLPPMPWALAGRAKPGASALLVADPSFPDDPSTNAVVAAQPYGLGKVLWVGTDGTWRWRLRVGDAYHHRFWGQVVRWAAEAATAPGGNRLVRFGPDRPRLPSGLPVSLFARFAAEVPGIGPDLIAAARIVEATASDSDATVPSSADPIALVPLHPSPDRPGTFEATAPALPPGRYRALLDVPSLAETFVDAGLPSPEATFEVAPEPTTELIDLAADPSRLASLASATGGQVLRDFDAGLLPDLLRSQALEQTRTAETPLWDTPLGLLLFVSLLTAEWLLRKRAGLP